jgi:hypothetical protein
MDECDGSTARAKNLCQLLARAARNPKAFGSALHGTQPLSTHWLEVPCRRADLVTWTESVATAQNETASKWPNKANGVVGDLGYRRSMELYTAIMADMYAQKKSADLSHLEKIHCCQS